MSCSFDNPQKCSHIESKHSSELDLGQKVSAIQRNVPYYMTFHFITLHFSYWQASTSNSNSNNSARSMRYQENDMLFSYSLNSLSKRDDTIEDDATGSGTGLVGLQNIANTCYMNSALQALSNLSPVTHYFINCSEIVEHIASTPRSKPAGLAKSYQRLMQEIWLQIEDPKRKSIPPLLFYLLSLIVSVLPLQIP